MTVVLLRVDVAAKPVFRCVLFWWLLQLVNNLCRDGAYRSTQPLLHGALQRYWQESQQAPYIKRFLNLPNKITHSLLICLDSLSVSTMPDLSNPASSVLIIEPLHVLIATNVLGPLYIGMCMLCLPHNHSMKMFSLTALTTRRDNHLCRVRYCGMPIVLYVLSRVRLYGISTVQAVLYYQHSHKDGVLLKCVVSNLRTNWYLISPLNLNIGCVSRFSACGAVLHTWSIQVCAEWTSLRLLDTGLFGVLIYAGWLIFVGDSGAFPALLGNQSW